MLTTLLPTLRWYRVRFATCTDPDGCRMLSAPSAAAAQSTVERADNTVAVWEVEDLGPAGIRLTHSTIGAVVAAACGVSWLIGRLLHVLGLRHTWGHAIVETMVLATCGIVALWLSQRRQP